LFFRSTHIPASDQKPAKKRDDRNRRYRSVSPDQTVQRSCNHSVLEAARRARSFIDDGESLSSRTMADVLQAAATHPGKLSAAQTDELIDHVRVIATEFAKVGSARDIRKLDRRLDGGKHRSLPDAIATCISA
jgi:hypothetical protein